MKMKMLENQKRIRERNYNSNVILTEQQKNQQIN